jgi:hypothetical protein
MANTGSLTADEHGVVNGTGPFATISEGVTSFLIAGTVLFASLVIGSSMSLLLAGSDAVISAILRGFLSLGLMALGGFVAGVVLALAIAAFRRSRNPA